jgi:phosphatidylglycerol---prolipoprotein diacylglyceryl transferase
MLPFFAPPAFSLGPLTVEAFGVAVAVAFWIGLTMFDRRIEARALDADVSRQLSHWMLAGGVVGAHLFSVLIYFPEKLRRDPWLLLRVWEDISSFGGMLGGGAAALAYLWTHPQVRRTADRLALLDAAAFVFPVALAIGRFGCALAHDHLGRITSFPLAISLATAPAQDLLAGAYAAAELSWPADAAARGFFDLGLLECVFLVSVVVPLFMYWDRDRRPPGFYLFAFAALYLPVRFGLDTLRVTDARYAGLTPAQWVAAVVVPLLPLFVIHRRVVRYALCGGLLLATACACTAGAR